MNAYNLYVHCDNYVAGGEDFSITVFGNTQDSVYQPEHQITALNSTVALDVVLFKSLFNLTNVQTIIL